MGDGDSLAVEGLGVVEVVVVGEGEVESVGKFVVVLADSLVVEGLDVVDVVLN